MSERPAARASAWFAACAEPGLHLLARLGGPAAENPRADQLLLTIALQESGLVHRVQRLASGAPGPARGWWQFERLGGVAGVLGHPASATVARRLCERLYVPASAADVWRCLEGHDALAAGFARLLLWTDPHALPQTRDAAGGWDYYLRLWRPGTPHPATWGRHWETAAAALDR
jgi:hypothetical protein